MTTPTRKPISLKKAEEKVILSLKKKDITDAPTCAVGLALDVSGSMDHNYKNGSVADVVTRILALAKTFDDDGSMDVWTFDTGSRKIANATEDNYESFVQKEIIDKRLVGGGTAYSPCLNSMYDFYFGSKATKLVRTVTEPAKGFFGKLFGKTETKTVTETVSAPSNSVEIPALAVFITDGETGDSDIARCHALFASSQNKPIYWLLVGVGGNPSHFEMLEDAADKYPNVGYLQFSDMDMSDETLYDGVISQEFVDWVTKK